MRTIALMNQKGGSAKTTSTVNLAAALAAQKKRVLVLDLDPQANASNWLGVTDGGSDVLDVLKGERKLADCVRASSTKGVDLVPSSPWLAGAERTLAGEVGAEVALRKSVEKLPGGWDVLLVDCPPALGLLSVSALTACKEVLVPVESHTLALSGLAHLVSTIERVRDRLNPSLRLSGILACRVDTRKRLSQDVLSSLRERFGSEVFEAVVRENVRLAEAPSFQRDIFQYDPKSSGAEDYLAVGRELLSRAKARTKRPQ